MLLGNSVYHVNQSEGKVYSVDEIRGYYNDLTEKVTRFGLENDDVPKTVLDNGEEIFFSIAIFQYGLAAYDLYLMNGDESMLRKTLACADWAVTNQEESGGWITFAYKSLEQPYSSMAQGEAISLLSRAYIITQDDKYIECARKAKEFMLIPLEKGGTTSYFGEDVYFHEYTMEPVVLNGWIFSLWGIFDYYKLTKDEALKEILDATLKTLHKSLEKYDIGYWSVYDIGQERICSPFYHQLHIAQLRVMHKLFDDVIYKEYADVWENYQKNGWNRNRAFLKKAVQKILEKK